MHKRLGFLVWATASYFQVLEGIKMVEAALYQLNYELTSVKGEMEISLLTDYTNNYTFSTEDLSDEEITAEKAHIVLGSLLIKFLTCGVPIPCALVLL